MAAHKSVWTLIPFLLSNKKFSQCGKRVRVSATSLEAGGSKTFLVQALTQYWTRQSKLCETQKAIWWAWWVCVGDGWVVSESVDTGCHKLLENIWCVWSKTSYSGDKWRCYRCGTDERTNDERRTREDSATQPMDAGSWVSQKKSR